MSFVYKNIFHCYFLRSKTIFKIIYFIFLISKEYNFTIPYFDQEKVYLAPL